MKWAAAIAGALVAGASITNAQDAKQCSEGVCLDVRYNENNDRTTVKLYLEGNANLAAYEYMGLLLPEDFQWQRGDEAPRRLMAFVAHSTRWTQDMAADKYKCFGANTRKCDGATIRNVPEENGNRLFAGRCKTTEDVCSKGDVNGEMQEKYPFSTLTAGGDTLVDVTSETRKSITVKLSGEYTDSFEVIRGEFRPEDVPKQQRSRYDIVSGADTPITIAFGETSSTDSPVEAPTEAPSEDGGSSTESPTTMDGTGSPTMAPTMMEGGTESPTMNPVTDAPTMAPTVFVVETVEEVLDGGSLSYEVNGQGVMNLTLETRIPSSEGWIGIGISDDGEMVGSSAIIAQVFGGNAEPQIGAFMLNGKSAGEIVPIESSRRSLAEGDCDEPSVTVENRGGENFLILEYCGKTIGEESFVNMGTESQSGEVRGLITAFRDSPEIGFHGSNNVDQVEALAVTFPNPGTAPPGGSRPNDDDDDDSNAGAIAGGVIGGIVLVCLIALVAVKLSNRKAKLDDPEQEKTGTNGAPPPAFDQEQQQQPTQDMRKV